MLLLTAEARCDPNFDRAGATASLVACDLTLVVPLVSVVPRGLKAFDGCTVTAVGLLDGGTNGSRLLVEGNRAYTMVETVEYNRLG